MRLHYKIPANVQLSRQHELATVCAMPNCPNCGTSLNTMRQRDGLFYLCPGCQGRAVTFPQIRRVTGDRFVTGLIREINRNATRADKSCPFCQRQMRLFSSAAPPLELDACKTCNVVWFDSQEFEAVPEGAVASTHELQLQGIETLARHRLENLREQQHSHEPPAESWKWIPAIFGFPVETETNALRRWPLFTWALALLIVLVSIWGFGDETRIDEFGFVPADRWRWGGLTLLSSFFLHGGIFHLVGNLYFLLVFGDNVEDFLGRVRYGLLILTATLTGDIIHLLSDPSSTTPCIGASGGISGIIVFYALQFPKARLGFMFRYFLYFRWFQIPAWGALGLWLLMQAVGLFMQLNGFSNVAATAHLGGAAIGFACWLWWRHQEHQLDAIVTAN